MVGSMNSYKALGLNFFTTNWHIMTYIHFNLAETFIAPIPKIEELKSIKDLRLISLYNVLLKIISTVLVRRIRPHLEDLTSLLLQCNFIPNRGTTDIVMIV